MHFLILLAPVVVVAVVAYGAMGRADRRRGRRRADYLADYPSLGSVLAMCDKDKYREIRDRNGHTGVMQARLAVMRDFPGITLSEAAEVVASLDK